MFDTDSEMSFAEKSIWIQLLVSMGVSLGYFGVVLWRAADAAALTDVAYQGPLIVAFIVCIVATFVAHAAVAIVTKDCGKQDERDSYINRVGETVRAGLLSLTLLLPLGLAMAEVRHFWIANSIYAACILSEFIAQSTKLVGYRRGSCE